MADKNINITKPEANAASNNDSENIILVVCALAKEAKGFEKVLNRKQIKFDEKVNKFECNYVGYKIIIVWGSNPGKEACTNLLDRWIKEIGKEMIKLLFMTGICAGWKEKTNLGDIVVADLVYDYANDMVIKKDDPPEFNTRYNFSLDSDINDWVAMSATEKDNPVWKEFIPLDKPPTRAHIKEHTLYLLSQGLNKTDIIKTIQKDFSVDYQATIEKVSMHEIQNLKEKDFIRETENTSYKFTEQGKKYFEKIEQSAIKCERKFPYTDDMKCPRVIVGGLGCGPELRKDEFIETLTKFSGYRKTVAVNMESYAIMKRGHDEKIPACVVKSVSDYGDMEKNDDYHDYATQTSAAFVLCMIKQYLPKIGNHDAAAAGALNEQQ